MSQLPVRYSPQASQQKGPYINVLCSGCSSHGVMVPFLPGTQWYSCPICFYDTEIIISSSGQIRVGGKSNYDYLDFIQRRKREMERGQIPIFPIPNPPGSLDDFINSIG